MGQLRADKVGHFTADSPSNAKIKKALGVERMPVEAREGLRRTLEAFKEK